MIPPKQVISTIQSNGVSLTFTAQWYKDVAAVLNISYGTGASITVALEGSLDNTNWVTVTTSNFVSATVASLEKPMTGFYLYYRLNITANTSPFSFITNAYIGCGGA